MAEKSVQDRVKEIIVEQLGVNPDQVTPEAKRRSSFAVGLILHITIK